MWSSILGKLESVKVGVNQMEGGKPVYLKKTLAPRQKLNNKLSPRMALGQNQTWVTFFFGRGGKHSLTFVVFVFFVTLQYSGKLGYTGNIHLLNNKQTKKKTEKTTPCHPGPKF